MSLRLSFLCVAATVPLLYSQTDPGPRAGEPAAGRALPGLNALETAFFTEGAARFSQVDTVASGLGPRFNLNSCSACHAAPAPGGASPAVNPQIAVATAFGAQNTVPSFVQSDGPIRAVRFARTPAGAPDGVVHQLFVITGRDDAGGCNIQQPDFATAVARNNAFFRIPSVLYGAGLIEAITDSTILANRDANGQQKNRLGIQGHENRDPADGTVTRYGWKAQTKSLLMFAGQAYNIEQGVTNELFPSKQDETPGCTLHATPEDRTDLAASTPLAGLSDITAMAGFMRFLAPPRPAPDTPSIASGRAQFNQIGCALCHSVSLNSGAALSAALANQPVFLYSDLLVHRMGSNLNDNIQQGLARGDEWRTAPLWGLGQRLFLMHDGRTSDLMQSIQLHSGQGSESNAVVNNFNGLSAQAKQDILNFLRSL